MARGGGGGTGLAFTGDYLRFKSKGRYSAFVRADEFLRL